MIEISTLVESIMAHPKFLDGANAVFVALITTSLVGFSFAWMQEHKQRCRLQRELERARATPAPNNDPTDISSRLQIQPQ